MTDWNDIKVGKKYIKVLPNNKEYLVKVLFINDEILLYESVLRWNRPRQLVTTYKVQVVTSVLQKSKSKSRIDNETQDRPRVCHKTCRKESYPA